MARGKRVKIEPYKTADMSTAHITLEDNKLLAVAANDSDSPLPVYDKEGYGWFIYIQLYDKRTTSLSEYGFSTAFCDLIAILQRRKFLMLVLDCDGETIENLPTFKW